MLRREVLFVVLLSLSAIGGVTSWRAGESAEVSAGSTIAAVPLPAWHGPSALWLAPNGRMLFAACEKSGAIAIVDLVRRKDCECAVGKSLVAMAATPDGRNLAACDPATGQLVLLDERSDMFRPWARVAMPAAPVGVTVSADGRTAFVSCLWSWQIVRVNLATAEIEASIELSFAPRMSRMLADGKSLVVADAFGGNIAIVDTAENRVVRERSIPAHNIRGLAVSRDGRELLVTHMMLTESAATTRDNVFWGITMTSNLRRIPVWALVDPEVDDRKLIYESQTHFFGDPGHGAGDPGATAVTSDGTTLVCLQGVGEVAIGRAVPYSFQRLPVGQCPKAIVLSPDERTAYVACSHSDTISIIDVPRRAVTGEIRIGDMAPRLTPEQQGEQLFYDAKLSLDGWFSCHSCHPDGHTNGQNADTLGDGAYGAPKQVLSLLGASRTGPWAWNGSKHSLDDQIRQSMKTTMQPKTPIDDHAADSLVAFIKSLSPPPVADWQRRDADAIERGRRVFESRGCGSCHTPPAYTSDAVYEVGLDDGDAGNRRFNPPSLRGVAHSAPYFHDGRAKSLDAVFRDHQHKLTKPIPGGELADLVAFLRSL